MGLCIISHRTSKITMRPLKGHETSVLSTCNKPKKKKAWAWNHESEHSNCQIAISDLLFISFTKRTCSHAKRIYLTIMICAKINVHLKQMFIWIFSHKTSGATLKVLDIACSLLPLENKCSTSEPFKRRNKINKSEMCDSIYIMLYLWNVTHKNMIIIHKVLRDSLLNICHNKWFLVRISFC